MQKPIDTAPRHMPWLDWVRFGAAATVVFDHARGIVFVDYNSLDPASKGLGAALLMFIGRAGFEAVIVFFVISGFLVGGIALDRARAGTFNWKAYTADRVARIATPLIPAICLAVAFYYLTGNSVDWVEVAGNVLSLQGIFVAPLKADPAVWSLSYEVWFYILGGGVAACLTRFRLLPALIVVVALLVYLRLEPKFLLIWLIGAGAYFYRPRQLLTVQTCAAIALSMAAILLSQMTRDSQTLTGVSFISNDASIVVLALGVAWLLSCLRETGSPAMLARVGAWAAAPSYTLYLTHQPLLGLASYLGVRPGQLTLSGGLMLALLMFSAIAWALVVYWAFERNSWKVKRMLRRALRA